MSLSLVAAGYEVYAVVDASGTFSPLMKDLAVSRMVQAGVIPMTTFAVGCELQRFWYNPTGVQFGLIVGQQTPFYGDLISSFEEHTNSTYNFPVNSTRISD